MRLRTANNRKRAARKGEKRQTCPFLIPLDEETGQEVERVEYPCGNRDEDDIVDERPL
jgi:hypothetical protein